MKDILKWISTWARSLDSRSVVVGLMLTVVTFAIIFGNAEAKTLASPDGMRAQEVQEEFYHPFPMQRFAMEVEGDIFNCVPWDPRGVYVCRFLPPQ